MHSKLAVATTLPKLAHAVAALGLEPALAVSLTSLIQEMPDRSLSRPLLAWLAHRFQVSTLGELVSHPEAARWLERNASVESTELIQNLATFLASTESRTSGTPSPGAHQGAPSSEAEMRAWVEAHDVRELLDLPLSRAVEGHPDARVRRAGTGARGRRTLGKVLMPSTVELDEPLLEEDYGASEVAQIRAAAFAFLESRAEEIAAAVAEEQADLAERSPPARPGARRLYDALRVAREAVRARVKPRLGARLVERRVDLVESGPGRFTLQYNEVASIGPSKTEASYVSIPIDAFEDLALQPRCTCTPRPQAACAHVLSAIDAVVEILPNAEGKSRREAPADLERLLRALEEPRWAASLEALDQAVAKSDESKSRAEDHRLWWQILPGLGGLELNPWIQRRGRRGELQRPKPIAFERLAEDPELLSLPADRKVLDMIAPPWLRLTPHQRAMLLSRAFPRVLRAITLLIHHPRVFYGEDPDQLLSVRGGRLELVVEEGDDRSIRFVPRLDGEDLAPDALLSLILDPSATDIVHRLDPQAGTFTLIALDGAKRALLLALARHRFAFPSEARAEVVRRLPDLSRVLSLRMGPSFAARRISPSSRLTLRLEPVESSLKVELLVRPLASDPRTFSPGEGPAELFGLEGGELVVLARDVAAELAAARAAVAPLELRPNEDEPQLAWVIDDLERALALCARLEERVADVEVEWLKSEPWRVTRRATSSDLAITVRDGKRWFSLIGEAHVEGERVSLTDLLDAVRKKKKFVKVGAGRWVAIADELRQRLGRLDDLISHEEGELVLGSAALLALEERAQGVGKLEVSAPFEALRARIAATEHAEPELPPLEVTLRDYQRAGYRWLMRLASWEAGACLADDMGLGKTIQAIAVLAARGALGPALVVAPTSVAFNWIREIERAAPTLKPLSYRDAQEGRARLLEGLGPGQVLVASYGLVARDIERLKAKSFATLVLDEAQAIKNPTTRRAEAARELDARFRLALTGTPVENHLGELWSLFAAVSPGLLGSLAHFRNRFAVPIERDRDAERRAALSGLIRPFVLRRTKAEVARELPARTEVRLEVELSAEERRLYEAVRRAALETLERAEAKDAREGRESELADDRRFQVLAAITRLRQLACHPKLYDEGSSVPSTKLARLLALVESLVDEGHRALVFSQFTRHLALVRRALESAGIAFLELDGKTPAGERARRVDAFQRGEAPIFLISLKAGGTGLNLTAADYVIHLDPWWNPAVEDQATDRAHRIGQSRPVTVYRLVARGTIEEAILAESAEKRRLVADLLEGADVAASVSTEELIRLIREGALPTSQDGEDDAGEGPNP